MLYNLECLQSGDGGQKPNSGRDVENPAQSHIVTAVEPAPSAVVGMYAILLIRLARDSLI